MPALLGSIDELASRWRARPDAAVTIALCEALRSSPRPTLVEEVGQRITRDHGADAPVLLAAARMYMAAQRLGDAQTVLVQAGKAAPRDGQVYRWLGEVLLRRGDADRAMKVFERAFQFGAADAETRLWNERAKVLKSMQATAGMRAVAAEIARTAPLDGPRPPMESMTDTTTEVRVVKAPALGRADDDDDDLLTRRAAPIPREVRDLRAERELAETAPRPAFEGPSTGANMLAMPLGSVDEPSVTARFLPQSPQAPKPMFGREPETKQPIVPLAAPPPVPQPPARDPFASQARREPSRATAETPMGAPVGATIKPMALRDAPVAPEARDVLDALEIAGLFEPAAAPAGPAAAWDKAAKGTRGRGSIFLTIVTILFVGATAGTLFYVRDKRAKEQAEADAILAKVDETLHAGRGADLAGAEQQLSRAFELHSRSPRAALTWLRERALRGLLLGGEEIAFEEAIARAKEVGVPDEQVAFAHVASFLLQGDTVGAAGLLPTWDAKAGKDAWYQLFAGASLARAGDAHAMDRFEAATQLDPGLVVAQIALARATALEGDPAKAMERARKMDPTRAERAALVALAWARDPMRPEAPPPEASAATQNTSELPASLKFVPHAILAIRGVQAREWDKAKEEITAGLAVADGPGVASWLGSIALDTGDDALARKAALSAVSFSAIYPPARMLAARVALVGDRLDEALKATEDLDATSPDVAVVRGAAAYERLDVDGLARALEAVPEEDHKLPFLAAVVLAPDVLVGRAPTPPDKLSAMADDEAPWSDLVAMDAALDQGDMGAADAIAAQWTSRSGDVMKGDDRPLRALRLARLARYEGRLDGAEAASLAALSGGTVTPRVLAERVFTLVTRGRGADAGPLLAKYPLVLGPLGTWLSAYVAASNGKVDEAKARTSTLDPPPPGAPLLARTIVASALAAMHDRHRAADVLKPMLAAGYVGIDVQNAAIAAGFKKIDHGSKKPTFSAP